MTDYERGFKDGVEAAAKVVLENREKHGIFNRDDDHRFMANTILALAPSPEKAQEPSICNAESRHGHHCRREKGHAGACIDKHGNPWSAPSPPQPAPLPEEETRHIFVPDGTTLIHNDPPLNVYPPPLPSEGVCQEPGCVGGRVASVWGEDTIRCPRCGGFGRHHAP